MSVDLSRLSMEGRLAGAIAVGLGSWLALAAQARRAALARHGSRIVLCVSIGALALSMTFQVVASTLDAATGIPNLGRLLSNATVLVTVAAAELLLLRVRHGGQVEPAALHRRVLLLTGVLAGMVLLFAATPPDLASAIGGPQHLTVTYNSPYVYLYVAYLGGVLMLATVGLIQLIRSATRRLLRVALTVALLGSVCGVAYAVCKAVYLASYQLGGPLPPASEGPLARALYVLATAAFLAAVAVPPAGQRLDLAGAWCGRYRQYQRLFPLWQALYTAMPSIAIDPQPTRLASLLTVRDLSFHLYRRVIEIRDAQLMLRPFGLPASDGPPDAVTAAWALRAALAAHAAGSVRSTTGTDVTVTAAPRDLGEEVRWLTAVSAAYGRSTHATRRPGSAAHRR